MAHLPSADPLMSITATNQHPLEQKPLLATSTQPTRWSHALVAVATALGTMAMLALASTPPAQATYAMPAVMPRTVRSAIARGPATPSRGMAQPAYAVAGTPEHFLEARGIDAPTAARERVEIRQVVTLQTCFDQHFEKSFCEYTQ